MNKKYIILSLGIPRILYWLTNYLVTIVSKIRWFISYDQSNMSNIDTRVWAKQSYMETLHIWAYKTQDMICVVAKCFYHRKYGTPKNLTWGCVTPLFCLNIGYKALYIVGSSYLI